MHTAAACLSLLVPPWRFSTLNISATNYVFTAQSGPSLVLVGMPLPYMDLLCILQKYYWLLLLKHENVNYGKAVFIRWFIHPASSVQKTTFLGG